MKKRRKIETASNKNKETRKKKNLSTTYMKSSYPFIIHKFLYSSSLVLMIGRKYMFLEIMQSHREFIYYGKIFLTLDNLTLISVNQEFL